MQNVLIVDDSPLMHRLLAGHLAEEGCGVRGALDPASAFDKACQDPPDLILLDLVMPRMDGLETCRRLRGHDSTRAVPIIMVTTRSELANVETGYANGCNEYVTKPIDGTELLSKVRNIIGE